MLTFHREAAGRRDVIALAPEALVIAGWAGRDEAAIRQLGLFFSVMQVPETA